MGEREVRQVGLVHRLEVWPVAVRLGIPYVQREAWDGQARAKKLSPGQRSAIVRKAAAKRRSHQPEVTRRVFASGNRLICR